MEMARDTLDAKVLMSLELRIKESHERNARLMEILGHDSEVSDMKAEYALEIETKDNLLVEYKMNLSEM
jgi:hypothetical protein